MQLHLVITSPFGTFATGDVVADPDIVEQLLQTHAERVVKVVPPKPATLPKED